MRRNGKRFTRSCDFLDAVVVDGIDVLEAFDRNETIQVEPWAGTIDHFRVVISGIIETPLEGAEAVFELKPLSNYPYTPPYCYCHTPIKHPAIDPSIPEGRTNVCRIMLNPECVGMVDELTQLKGWTWRNTLTEVVLELARIIQNPFYWKAPFSI